MIRIKLPTHKHPLYPTPWVSRCKGCPRRGGYVKDGYRCYECAISFHKECAEAILEIHHPSHHAHPLSLVFKRRGPKNCKLCGVYLYNSKYYQCSICDFVVHTACAKNPPPNVIEYPKAHEHSLVIAKDLSDFKCDFCGEEIQGSYRYRCSPCRLEFEIGCSMLALEIDYPYHPKHPLKFLTKEEHHFSDGKCLICGEELGLKFYHCSICKFSVDVSCVRDPPPLTVLFPKAHEHQLSLTPRKISFDCDACGMAGDRSPYSCQQCYFMIHQICIDLPEIINVNRHEHRLSRRLHLSPESWVCGFCHKNVDWSYGAYSCSICPNYVIHSKCAIRDDVWDKLELKGIPEEPQDIEPFKVSSILTFNTSVLMLSVPCFLNLSSMKVIHAPCTTITTRIWNALLAINGTVNCLVAMTAALE
ncbi:BnaCnng42150D [Brassica napus]|uniref:BnaCnng42150D protein n=1 Tax=Brassica napus TaxID=3708 RepID=A0A078JEX5_BRANA|nr:BnaCnng42150D [Brassica napus]